MSKRKVSDAELRKLVELGALAKIALKEVPASKAARELANKRWRKATAEDRERQAEVMRQAVRVRMAKRAADKVPPPPA